jgi:hypothetical protein
MTSHLVMAGIEPSHHMVWADAYWAAYGPSCCDWIHPHPFLSIVRSGPLSLRLEHDSTEIPTKKEEVFGWYVLGAMLLVWWYFGGWWCSGWYVLGGMLVLVCCGGICFWYDSGMFLFSCCWYVDDMWVILCLWPPATYRNPRQLKRFSLRWLYICWLQSSCEVVCSEKCQGWCPRKPGLLLPPIHIIQLTLAGEEDGPPAVTLWLQKTRKSS